MTTIDQQDDNLKEHPLFKIIYSNKFTFKEYLSDCQSEIISILDLDNDEISHDDRYINLIANMNSGKTYSMLYLALKEDFKIIVVTPLKIIAMQKEKEINENPDLGNVLGVYEGVTSDNIKDKLEQGVSVFICVYDSLQKFFDPELKDIFTPSDYILAVDEAHSFVTEYGYRDNAINYNKDIEERFNRVLYLTGTPEATINRKHRSFLFEVETPPEKKHVKIMQYKYNRIELEKERRSEDLEIKEINIHENTLWHLFNAIINNNTKNLIVVLLDNNEKLIQLYTALNNYYATKRDVEKKNVKMLNSARKDSQTYINLADTEEISSDIDILLTTRVISDGVNIINEEVNLYVIDLNNSYWIKRQFIARFRMGVENIYELHSDRQVDDISLDRLNNYYDNAADKAEENKILLLEEFTNESKNLQRETKLSSFLFKSRIKSKNLYYSTLLNNNDEREIKVSRESINHNQISVINKALEESINLTSRFYSEIANYDVSTIDYGDIVKDNEISIKDYQKLASPYCIETLCKTPDLLEEMFDELLIVYISSSKKLHHHFIDKNIKIDKRTFAEMNKSEFDYATSKLDSKFKETMGEIVELLSIGFPRELVIKLIDLKSKKSKSYSNLVRKLDVNLKLLIPLLFNYDKNQTLFNTLKGSLFYKWYIPFQLLNEYIESSVANPARSRITTEAQDQWKSLISLTNPKVSIDTAFNDYKAALFKTSKSQGEFLIKKEITILDLLNSSNIEVDQFIIIFHRNGGFIDIAINQLVTQIDIYLADNELNSDLRDDITYLRSGVLKYHNSDIE